MEEKRKTLSQQMEDIIGEVCDRYCKFPEQFSAEDEDKLLEICMNCPLGRI